MNSTLAQLAHSSPDEVTARRLARLRYPGFAHIETSGVESSPDPTTTLEEVLGSNALHPRTVEGLVWMTARHAITMDWPRLLDHARRTRRTNRLGYLVHLGRCVAARLPGHVASQLHLESIEKQLESEPHDSEDVFFSNPTQAERSWLLSHRPDAATRWHVLTQMRDQDVEHAEELLAPGC